MKVLPDSYLRCMSPKDRRQLGQKTAEEVLAQGEAKSEKELQKQIVGLLRLKGIEVNVSRMDKRKTDTVGWPDLTFAVDCKRLIKRPSPLSGFNEVPNGIIACAWEIKMPQGVLSEEQAKIGHRLRVRPNGWRCRVIRSVDQAIAELKEMGL